MDDDFSMMTKMTFFLFKCLLSVEIVLKKFFVSLFLLLPLFVCFLGGVMLNMSIEIP